MLSVEGILTAATICTEEAKASTPRWTPWFSKAFWAIADQGFTSGSNFVSSILLARWLAPEQYGAYALALSVFLFLAGFHHNLLLSPMSVFGPTVYRDQKRNYMRVLLCLQAGFGLFISLGLAVCAGIAGSLGHGHLCRALIGLTVAAPCILLLWMTRAAYYVYLSPARATQGSIIYSVLQLAGLVFITFNEMLSIISVFVVTAIAAVVASSFLIIGLKPLLRRPENAATVSEVWRTHWQYGRWEINAGLVYAVAENIWVILTSAFLGMRETGALKAISNLLQPLSQTTVALTRLAVPHMSDITAKENRAAINRPVQRLAFLLGFGAIAYCGALTLFHQPMFKLFYRDRYTQFAYLVPLLGLGLAFQTIYQAFAVGLRALQVPKLVFKSSAVSAVVSVVLGVPMVRQFGLPGMIAGSIASGFALLCTGWYLFHQNQTREEESASIPSRAPMPNEAPL